ncbi:translesion error-prone DNA polymerase V autoproteolytic subunit [Acinetobacter sp. C_4_1]|uniref:LexA family protein n=1 Tax=unclassified Acinetobacter TaxID=196816 RepID=UPI0021B8272D|nr:MULTISPECIES: translesion error-prone DNA polymerase V autoproteolytic subunit [unclassified Acinetobacter]MCT8090867.1 translesion error-prone DNA polymerase V autoproteolytic subunit [Acinetobacter sp. F_3_1]MCT8099325.1 translesion error-prone DNA polymerase V autoproteolytic subunit [Acinetobacter sp. C_3_1]MCT8102307.1 translesion error-prone DNA polymerase V autoproteolytic subunit [Acinetobacter sp. C_4_1]MCT8136091.1 translesion error-prone DNA polymerase V autoproteolytic subunit [A
MNEYQHGGAREGSGRKPVHEGPTKVIRVPEARILEIRQYLDQVKKPARNDVASITPVEARTHYEIPVALQKVAAGFPSPAQDYIDKTLDLNEFLIQNQQATFIVEVESLSMRDAGIDLKDKLIVDRSIEPKHGDIVLALIDNDFTIKRLMIEGDKRWLQAENPDYADIHLKDGQTLLIWGVVTSVIKKFR